MWKHENNSSCKVSSLIICRGWTVLASNLTVRMSPIRMRLCWSSFRRNEGMFLLHTNNIHLVQPLSPWKFLNFRDIFRFKPKMYVPSPPSEIVYAEAEIEFPLTVALHKHALRVKFDQGQICWEYLF